MQSKFAKIADTGFTGGRIVFIWLNSKTGDSKGRRQKP
jgi:hypothetical protein